MKLLERLHGRKLAGRRPGRRHYTFNNSGATDPLNRGFRGSAAQGTDLQVWGTVF
jgi:hypothetical protein